MTVTVDTLVEGLALPVGARWRAGHLWFSDFFLRTVFAYDPASAAVNTVAEVPGRPGGVGFLPDGRLLVASALDRLLLRREADGTVLVHADLAGVTTHPLADVCVDARGRAYVGSRGESDSPTVTADLAMVEADGSVHDVAGALTCAGGIVVSADGSTLTVAETRAAPARLTAFTIDPDGSLAQQRVFAEFDEDIRPEGLAIDAEDGIWVASPATSDVLRLDADGVVSERLTVRRPCAVALGGEDGRDLFVCTSGSTVEEDAIADLAGTVLRLRVGVPGAGA
ncbi:SMP-30/gluconolactonase/LRE family protein [Rhodococcus sp. NPDC003318]|uniref:SMP-30/gluconolactonase/LRE family protein n=1 Tax=Rhodococcus sp. NPDC003318 TaxID=3364503 RepID=UPI00367F3871